MGSQIRKGIRAKCWRKTWVKAASALQDSSVDEFSGSWLAYVSANDKKDVPAASSHLERCLGLAHLLALPTQDLIAREAAVFSAWFRSDSSLAEKWLSQVKKPRLTQSLLQIRLEIAMSCSRRDFDVALDRWQEGTILIEKLPAASVKERLMESWLEWRAEIEERRTRLTMK